MGLGALLRKTPGALKALGLGVGRGSAKAGKAMLASPHTSAAGMAVPFTLAEYAGYSPVAWGTPRKPDSPVEMPLAMLMNYASFLTGLKGFNHGKYQYSASGRLLKNLNGAPLKKAVNPYLTTAGFVGGFATTPGLRTFMRTAGGAEDAAGLLGATVDAQGRKLTVGQRIAHQSSTARDEMATMLYRMQNTANAFEPVSENMVKATASLPAVAASIDKASADIQAIADKTRKLPQTLKEGLLDQFRPTADRPSGASPLGIALSAMAPAMAAMVAMKPRPPNTFDKRDVERYEREVRRRRMVAGALALVGGVAAWKSGSLGLKPGAPVAEVAEPGK